MSGIRMKLLCGAAVLLALPMAAQNKYFGNWPPDADPKTVGEHLASHFLESPHQSDTAIVYPEVCLWYGALAFSDVTGNADLRAKLQARFDKLMTQEPQLIPDREHVDFEIFGIVPLAISIEDKDAKLQTMGLRYADRQWSKPTPDGLSGETRFWIDDMFMLEILQLEAYRATGDAKYVDRGAAEMAAYLEKLQQPNGLFYHAPDVPFYWGRGNGWVAAGMAEMLTSLPEKNPNRAAILAGYRKMMAELVKDQASDGMWRQLIDHPESWEETSSTGMFTYALIEGVKHGWLDEETYGPAARKAWIALSGYIDQHYDVTNICIGTNKQNSYEYYTERPRHTGDFHGQAPAVWAARALLER